MKSKDSLGFVQKCFRYGFLQNCFLNKKVWSIPLVKIIWLFYQVPWKQLEIWIYLSCSICQFEVILFKLKFCMHIVQQLISHLRVESLVISKGAQGSRSSLLKMLCVFGAQPLPPKKSFELILSFKGYVLRTLTTLNRWVVFCFCSLMCCFLLIFPWLLRSFWLFINLTYLICIFENMGVAVTNHTLLWRCK